MTTTKDSPRQPNRGPSQTATATQQVCAEGTSPAGWRAVIALPDAELDSFVDQADPPLRRALRDLVPTPPPLEDARTVVACARIERRRRHGRRDADDLAELITAAGQLAEDEQGCSA